MCKTNSISPRGTRGARTGGGRCEVSSVKSGRFASRSLTSNFKPQTSHFPTGNCAKRSQTWGGGGIWAKAVLVRGVARPRSENVQNEPNFGCPGWCRSVNVQNEPNFGPPAKDVVRTPGEKGQGILEIRRGSAMLRDETGAYRRP
jgi:hypothetical protein